MRLWLDDVRPMPVDYDLHAKTAPEAIAMIEKGGVDEISFDHDLGPAGAGTGYDVAKYIEEQAFRRHLPPPRWKIHSANPVGRNNIKWAMQNADAYYNGSCEDAGSE